MLANACVASTDRIWVEPEGITQFYLSRGAKEPKISPPPACREIVVGPKAEPALWCDRIVHEARGRPGAPDHTYRVLTLASVRSVRANRAVVWFEVPIGFDLLDKDEPGEGSLFRVAAEAGAPATEIVVREPSEGACEEAKRALEAGRARALRERDRIQLAWGRLDEELRARICASTGRYVWKAGRFAREPKAAAASTGGSSGP